MSDNRGMKITMLLLLAIFVSCNGSGGGSSSTSNISDNKKSYEVRTRIPLMQRYDSLAYDLKIECENQDCSISGKIYRYFNASNLMYADITGEGSLDNDLNLTAVLDDGYGNEVELLMTNPEVNDAKIVLSNYAACFTQPLSIQTAESFNDFLSGYITSNAFTTNFWDGSYGTTPVSNPACAL